MVADLILSDLHVERGSRADPDKGGDRGSGAPAGPLRPVPLPCLGRPAGDPDKELSALLARELLVPVVHGISYGEVREESPLLASRTGLDTAEDSMTEIAVKISELVSTAW